MTAPKPLFSDSFAKKSLPSVRNDVIYLADAPHVVTDETQGDDGVSDYVRELLEDWETWQFAQSLSPRTVGDRAETVLRMARWCDTDPHLVSEAQVTRWLARGGVWKASTKHTYFTHLNSWFTWLVSSGRRADNPMLAMRAPRRPRTSPHPVDDRHLPLLLASARRRKTRAMLILALCQGLRAMEIAAFCGEQLDLVADQLTVVGKGSKEATVPLHPRVRELAAEMPASGWWFPSPYRAGQHITAKSVSQIVKEVFRRAGVPGSAHWLRHWFCTSLVEHDVDLATVQNLARHESMATTQIYVKVSERRKADGLGRIDPLAVVEALRRGRLRLVKGAEPERNERNEWNGME